MSGIPSTQVERVRQEIRRYFSRLDKKLNIIADHFEERCDKFEDRLTDLESTLEDIESKANEAATSASNAESAITDLTERKP